MSTWIYKMTERPGHGSDGLWTVGHYDPAGFFIPETDHSSADGAAARVHWLNGGSADESTGPWVAAPGTPVIAIGADQAETGGY